VRGVAGNLLLTKKKVDFFGGEGGGGGFFNIFTRIFSLTPNALARSSYGASLNFLIENWPIYSDLKFKNLAFFYLKLHHFLQFFIVRVSDSQFFI
jgi:hypothetical protein